MQMAQFFKLTSKWAADVSALFDRAAGGSLKDDQPNGEPPLEKLGPKERREKKARMKEEAREAAEEQKRLKKAKKQAKEEKVKKPLTAFILYTRFRRPDIVKGNPCTYLVRNLFQNLA